MSDRLPDLSNIQANILHGSKDWRHTAYMFIRFTDDHGPAADFLEEIRSDHMLSGTRNSTLGGSRAVNVNVAITWRGLLALGIMFEDNRFERTHLLKTRDTLVYGFGYQEVIDGGDGLDSDGGESIDPHSGDDEAELTGAEILHSLEFPTEPWSAFPLGLRLRWDHVNDRWPLRPSGGWSDPSLGPAFSRRVYRWPDNGDAAHAWWMSDASEWVENPDDWPHAMLWVSADSPQSRDAKVQAIEAMASQNPEVDVVGVQHGDVGGKVSDPFVEHFGFVDGISQPAIRGIRPGRPGDGKLGASGWEGLEAGEFVLGYEDEGHQVLPLPDPPEVSFEGTFMVYRRLEQDVGVLDELVNQIADRYDLDRVADRDRIKAKLMGRHVDGTPTITPPGAGPRGRTQPAVGPAENDFRYHDDPHGLQCPLNSHVRRANPRDDLHFEGRLTNRHRMIRRGMPYTEEYEVGSDTHTRIGLAFIALAARLEDQFEFVQREWLNRGRAFRSGNDAEPIAGNPGVPPDFWMPLTLADYSSQRHDTATRVTITGDHPWLAMIPDKEAPMSRFRGGDYFFLPSLSGIDAIVALARGETPAPLPERAEPALRN